MIFKVLLGKDNVVPKTENQKSRPKSIPIVYDWSDADEAQSRAVRAATQVSVHLHNLAVRDAQEAHAMACDMHAAAVEMHNDFACGGCDQWF